MFKKFGNCTASFKELVYSISTLCRSIYQAFNKKIMLLIDNYDSFFLNTINTEFFDEFYSFYKQVLIEIFNDDIICNYIFKSFITGKINIPLNNEFKTECVSVFDDEYREYYSISQI